MNNLFLEQPSRESAAGSLAVLMWDGAASHTGGDLVVTLASSADSGEARDAALHGTVLVDGAAPAHGHDAVEGGSALFSPSTDHSVTTAFNTLAATRLADNSDDLLGLARDMIRPLLKSWLDDNLPSMVERMVRAEIERVARGGR